MFFPLPPHHHRQINFSPRIKLWRRQKLKNNQKSHRLQNLPREINRLVPARLTANPAESTGGRDGNNSWLGAKLLGGGGGGGSIGLRIMHHCWGEGGVKMGMGPEFHASRAWQTVETRAVTIHWPTPKPLHSLATLFLASDQPLFCLPHRLPLCHPWNRPWYRGHSSGDQGEYPFF